MRAAKPFVHAAVSATATQKRMRPWTSSGPASYRTSTSNPVGMAGVASKRLFCVGSPACLVCGAPHPEDMVQLCPAPKSMRLPMVRKGLGNRLEQALKSVGVTEDRYKEV